MNILSQLLKHYHLNMKDLDARKASGSFHCLETPYEDPKFKEVINRILDAKNKHEKVVIYGDYDVDGITSTAIMKIALNCLEIPSGYFIPSRFKEGYGLNEQRVEEFYQKGYSLIICVDNGISAFSAINKARELGMDVVVIDHHDVPDEKVNTPYIFHFAFCKFISYPCSAASLSFFVASALLKKYNYYLATLAGLAVFSDVMPLVGNNLQFAKIMLSSIRTYQYKNLLSLLQGAYGSNSIICTENITYNDVIFNIISVLNAPGRICKDSLSTNLVCKFLIEKDNNQLISSLSKQFIDWNQAKKNIVNNMVFHNEFSSQNAVVYCVDDYSGLTGLFANRILQNQKKSTLIFAPVESNSDQLVGSLRAYGDVNVLNFVRQNMKYFLSFGGHPKAAGVTIRKKDYFQIATLFASDIEKQNLLHEKEPSDNNAFIEIDFDDLNEENYHVLEMFLPFGEGFEEPVFHLVIPKDKFKVSASGKVAFAFNDRHDGKVTLFSSFELLKNPEVEALSILGTFTKENFGGKTTYVLMVRDVKKF